MTETGIRRMLIIGASVLAPMVLSGGFIVSPEWIGKPVDSYVAPAGINHYQVRRPDGQIWLLEYHPLGLWQLQGEFPWVGEVAGRYVRLCTNPQVPITPQEILFRDGRLLYANQYGRSYDFSFNEDGLRGAPLETLWPKAPEHVGKAHQNDERDFWRNTTRLRLWYLDPNRAAVLCVQIALIGLTAFLFTGGFWRIHGAVWLASGFAAMIQSSSRGGFVGFLCGAAVLGSVWVVRSVRRRLFRKGHVICIAVASLLMVVCATIAGGGRFSSHLMEQEETTDRRALWNEAPHMIADAPGGWGWGNSGRVYVEWYCDIRRTHFARSLISTHLTWLVEMGNTGRVAYVLAWFLALVLLLESVRSGRSALPLALALSFFANAMFSHIGSEVSLWAGPVLAFVIYLAGRPWRRMRSVALWASAAVVLGIAAASFLLYVCPHSSLSRNAGHFAVRYRDRAVMLNGDDPGAWIVDDSREGYALSCGFYTGREIRSFFSKQAELPPVGIVKSVDELPPDARRVLVAGMSCVDYLDAWRAKRPSNPPEQLVFVSPPFAPSAVPADLLEASSIKMLVGEFAARRWPICEKVPSWVEIVKGAEIYLPDWMQNCIQIIPST